MQYVYFGVVPLIVASLLVYRAWYLHKPASSGSQIMIIAAFAIIYAFKFGIVVGLGTVALTLLVTFIYSSEIIKDREREQAKLTSRQYSKQPADIANKSFDDYAADINSIAESKGSK